MVGDDQLVHRVALGRRNKHWNAVTVQHDGANRLVDQEIHEAHRLRRCVTERWHASRLAGIVVASPVGCQELDQIAAAVDILRGVAAIATVRDGTERRIDGFQHIEDRGDFVLDLVGDGEELGEIGIAGLDDCARQADAEVGGIGLEGNRADQDGAQPEQPCSLQSLDDVAGKPVGSGEPGLANKGGNEAAAPLELLFAAPEFLDTPADLRVDCGSDIAPPGA